MADGLGRDPVDLPQWFTNLWRGRIVTNTTATARTTRRARSTGRASTDAATGGHRRSILIKALHQDGTTRAGRPRRTGYKLVSEEPKVLR